MPSYIHKESYHAPWEKSFGQILTPLEDFIHKQTTAGKLLIASALLALFLANGPFAEFYFGVLHTKAGLSIGGWALEHSIHHWINDGLMTFFFFTVGLEIKRELIDGDLSELRAATLPIVAAIGGMLVPALLYLGINNDPGASHGWGIPMATDIAFAVGVLVMLGDRIPKALFTFLIALAIIDDLGAVAVIAVFYTDTLHVPSLAISAFIVFVLISFNLGGVRSPLPYFILGVLLWLALSKSGVHATVAGIFTAWTVPTRPKLQPNVFIKHIKQIISLMASQAGNNTTLIHNAEQSALIQAIESGVHQVESPLQRLERNLHIPVSLMVLPLFALANAGIRIDSQALLAVVTQSAPLSIAAGLIVGKLVGIAGFALLTIKLGLATYPTNCNARHIIGIGLIGGIGFTMSIFITDLAFKGQPELIETAKLSILIASAITGIGGLLWLRYASKK